MAVRAKGKLRNPRRGPSLGGITRLARPDRWAVDLGLRVDGSPFDLHGREYIEQVIRDTSDQIVVKKAAQMAFTITFLVRTAHWVVERRWHHLYLLPVKTGAISFVQSRIDPIINSSPLLRTNFASVDNRLHKQSTDDIKWLIRGTNIDTELQEVPVDVEVWDERDRMVEDNLEDARHRMDGSEIKKLTQLSTPTVPGHGIDSSDAWHASDQHLWEVPCPACSRFQVFTFDENVNLGSDEHDSIFICKHCKKEISDQDRRSLNSLGHWSPHKLDARSRGYHVSQFNSSTLNLNEILRGWFVGQRESKKLRSFFNNSLGEPYVAPGDQFTPELLDKSVKTGLNLGGIPDGAVYIGVDVGNVLHCKVSYLDRASRRIAWQFKIFRTFDDLERFLDALTTFSCVIDAHPEKSKARDLSLKFPGKVWLGFEKDRPDTDDVAVFSKIQFGEPCSVTIDRTMAFDDVINSYMMGNTILPSNARELGEHLPNLPYNGFYNQMIQQVRVEEEDAKGRLVARWRRNKNPDHWHHADMFELISTLNKPRLVIPVGLGETLRATGGVMG